MQADLKEPMKSEIRELRRNGWREKEKKALGPTVNATMDFQQWDKKSRSR